MPLDTKVRAAFERALDPRDVLSDPVQCRSYECDGLTGYRVVPELVLLPRDTEQVAAAVRVCHEHGVPFVARGAGTGLSGGALPVADGVVISLARLKRVLEVDPADRRAVVQPGVTNLEITAAAAPLGLYFAPDPVQPAGLHDRRQRRGELRRRPLPQVRLHHQPRPELRGGAPRRVGRHAGHRHLRAGRARPARGVPRLGGHARHHDVGHRAAAAGARVGAHAAGRLRVDRERGRGRLRHRRRPGSCPPPWR
jgi:hypothetical protein